MYYTIETVEDISQIHPRTLRCLKKLTHREITKSSECGMKYILGRIERLPKEWSCKKAFIARNTSGKIIAWGMLTKNTNRHYSMSLDFEFNVYVAGKYRKRGIGRELFNEACVAMKRKRGKLEFHPWNKQSTNFYSKIVTSANARQRQRFDRHSVAETRVW